MNPILPAWVNTLKHHPISCFLPLGYEYLKLLISPVWFLWVRQSKYWYDSYLSTLLYSKFKFSYSSKHKKIFCLRKRISPEYQCRKGKTHLPKSTPTHLGWLTARQQEVPGSSNMNGRFAQSWAHLGLNKVFSTQWRFSINKSGKPAQTVSSLLPSIVYIHVYQNCVTTEKGRH